MYGGPNLDMNRPIPEWKKWDKFKLIAGVVGCLVVLLVVFLK